MHEQHLKQAVREAIAERAAILEHEAGLPRIQATGEAIRAMRVYRIVGTERVLVLPGVELQEARKLAEAKMGNAVTLERIDKAEWL